MTPPKSLVNGTTADINEHNKPVPSALLTPEWVTKTNMKSTVIKDNFVPTKQICSGTFDGKVSHGRAPARQPASETTAGGLSE